MTKDIVDIYLECGNFHEAVKQSGLPVHIAHLKLLKSGVLKIQDKIQYGSNSAKLGGKAEELFQQLVPDAIDANKYFQKNNPVYDFCYKSLYIDVKYSSLRQRNGRGSAKHWQIRVSGSQDFTVAFLEREQGSELNNPFILLIPNAFIDTADSIHISKSGIWFKEFSVDADQLRETLKEYGDLRDVGSF